MAFSKIATCSLTGAPSPGDVVLPQTPTQLHSFRSCFHGKQYLANLHGAADQLWKFCTAVCFWESRRSSSRIALMREAEEWPGCRSSVELAA